MEKVLDRHFRASTTLIRTEESKLEGMLRPEGLEPEGFLHRPVLFRQSVQHLAVRPGGVYIDCTVGEGGHAWAVLQASLPGGQLLGIDLDPQALDGARRRLQPYDGSFTLVQASYARLAELAVSIGFQEPDGILLDLGLSSLQLESQGRGFSFLRDDALDMRYDPEATLTAAHIVNNYPQEDLVRVISSYGEETRARSIARAITQSRPLSTTLELANLVARVSGPGRGRIHPATRTFQALRIAVNSELENLTAGLQQAIGLLKLGGKLVVISYHSLEDRIVKQTMAREARGCICPPRVPVCTCGHTPTLKLITRKVVTPAAEEVRANPRSRSAHMRVAERIQE